MKIFFNNQKFIDCLGDNTRARYNNSTKEVNGDMWDYVVTLE